MPLLDIVLLATRALVAVAALFALIVWLTHWAVRHGTLQPFGAWPRFVRTASDPLVTAVERRLLRAGGNPQDAPLWLLGIAIVGGLLLLWVVRLVAISLLQFQGAAGSGGRGIVLLLAIWTFNVLNAALLVRVIGSWFGASPYGGIMRIAYALTNWLIEPIRRVVPPFGMLDLSPLIAYGALYLARGALIGLIAG